MGGAMAFYPDKITYCLKEYLEEAFGGSSLKAVGRKTGLSPDYLRRIFKDLCGGSYREHLLKRKILKASVLLVFTNIPIRAIALRYLHFQTVSSFYRLFKKASRKSPSEFRILWQSMVLYGNPKKTIKISG